MDPAMIPTTGVAAYITELAREFGVKYKPTPHDALAGVITKLSDDDVKLDGVVNLIIALERSHVIPSQNVVPLHVNYLREKLYVRRLR